MSELPAKKQPIFPSAAFEHALEEPFSMSRWVDFASCDIPKKFWRELRDFKGMGLWKSELGRI
jgi:hypothetical protein